MVSKTAKYKFRAIRKHVIFFMLATLLVVKRRKLQGPVARLDFKRYNLFIFL